MAILNHVEVRLLVNSQALPEYNDDEAEDSESPSSTSNYVEVVSKSRFEVEIRQLDGINFGAANYLHCDIFCDGALMKRVALFKKGHKRFSGVRKRVKTVDVEKNGASKQFELHFGDVVTRAQGSGSAGDVAPLNATYKDLGSIKVNVYRTVAEDGPSLPLRGLALDAAGLDSIPEKALKGRAVSLKTGLTNGVPITPRKSFRTRAYDTEPLATFTFKYRSRKDLQSLLIIPRSPSPIPLEERPEEDLSAEELRELLRRHRARDRRTESHKRERSNSIEGRRPKIKREGVIVPHDDISFVSARSKRQADTEEIETIDLT